jgi:hypothetical protein
MQTWIQTGALFQKRPETTFATNVENEEGVEFSFIKG